MPRSLFLRLAIRADDDTRLAKLLHAADHVGAACGHIVPKADQQVAGLRHLVIAAHACGLPKALPVCGEAARAHVMPHGPAKAEPICAPRTAVHDFGEAVAFWRQRVTQELIVGERA